MNGVVKAALPRRSAQRDVVDSTAFLVNTGKALILVEGEGTTQPGAAGEALAARSWTEAPPPAGLTPRRSRIDFYAMTHLTPHHVGGDHHTRTRKRVFPT